LAHRDASRNPGCSTFGRAAQLDRCAAQSMAMTRDGPPEHQKIPPGNHKLGSIEGKWKDPRPRPASQTTITTAIALSHVTAADRCRRAEIYLVGGAAMASADVVPLEVATMVLEGPRQQRKCPPRIGELRHCVLRHRRIRRGRSDRLIRRRCTQCRDATKARRQKQRPNRRSHRATPRRNTLRGHRSGRRPPRTINRNSTAGNSIRT
jgi:hypothetical protein